MELEKLPLKIHKEIDTLVRRYVWREMSTGKKVHLVNWDIMCKSKELGGVGLRKSSLMNKALLSKLA